MTLPRFLAILLFMVAGQAASAFEGCQFSFRIDAQSSALQALIQGASERGGFWRPIAEAPDDVQDIGRYIGRLDVCLMTPDGKPRTVTVSGRTRTLKSPQMTTCTAALLPGNRLLTNSHCFYNDVMVEAGFTFVQEARINFGYTAADFTGNVKTYAVSTRELARDADLDAMVLQIFGADANEALGGHVPMVMQPRVRPRRALTMIHHPNGDPQQFSSGTCQVHPDQAKLPEAASQLRHSCETTGGSSGSLLLDARSLAVVGLHNQGGLHGRGGYNGGHKIAAVEAALGLGFQAEAARAPVTIPKPDPETLAQEALTEALQLDGITARRAALEEVVSQFPSSRAARSARNALDLMAPRQRSPEERASDALIAALALGDDAGRKRALTEVLRQFPVTPAGKSAKTMLDLMAARSVAKAPQPRPKPSVRMAKALKLVSWGGAYQQSQNKAYVEPYVARNRTLNVSWDSDSSNAVSVLRKGDAKARSWDLVDVAAADAIRLCEGGQAERIDFDRVLAPAPDGTPPSADFGKFLINDCFVPQIAYSTTIGYRTDLVGRQRPRSVCDIFDLRRFPGKRALEKRPINNMEWALLCDGVPESRLYEVLATRRGQDRALAKLDTIKDYVIWWSAGKDTPQLLADGEVVMGSAYNGRLFSLIEEQRQPVDILWDRQVIDLDGWIIPKGLPADRRARVLDFLYFATDTQRLADQAHYISYGPARRSSAPLVGRHKELGVDMQRHIPTGPDNFATALLYNYDFWAEHRSAIDSRFSAWLKR